MTTTYDDILSRLNMAVIQSDAEYAAAAIKQHGYASVFISPGDMTQYHFVILGKGAVELDDVTGLRERRDYLVTLTNQFGASYPWAGDRVHPDYAIGKWTRGGGKYTHMDVHTGTVVSAFLTALAAELGA